MLLAERRSDGKIEQIEAAVTAMRDGGDGCLL